MKQYLLLLFFIMCIDIVHAQELNVKSFVVKTNDITARTQPRQDINGNDCALIKVQLAASGAEFGGNVVGNVSYNKSEYLVYMSEGSKRLSVKLEGYLPLEASFEDYGIKTLEGKTTYVMTISGATVAQQIEAPKIKTGWIILESEPSGASVYINNEFVGNTPLNNYKQSYGTYQYRLESPNYHPATGTIELNAGKFEQRIALKPAFGSISVKSNVAGAKILLDGKPTGKNSPATLTEIPSGSHTITLQMDKYAPRQQEVIVEDGQTASVSMSLDARFARITINSLDGAEIYSNGKLLGKGRISEGMMEGYYDLEARLNHHKSVTKQIQVVAGQSQEITLNPVPKYGSLDIVSTPHDATIIIDGKEVGRTPYTIDKLLEGEHTVTISKEGYSVFKKVVNISENNTETVSATMEEGIQFSNNEGNSSLKLVGRLTEKDWGKLQQLLKENKDIRSVDLSQAECETIPNHAFFNDSNLVSITLPNGLISIGEKAFFYCKNLTTITLPDGLTNIGNYAFEGCIKLTSINIPNSVSFIGYSAFEKTGWFDSQPLGIVYAGRVAYEYKGKMRKGTNIILRDGTSGIACGAFLALFDNGLTSISIPESVTNIGSGAFSGCESLLSIKIPVGVTSIGSAAFDGCISLTSANIPNNVVRIEENVFRNCESLSSISIPESVMFIGKGAFLGCKNFTHVTIPNNVTTIGANAFEGCTNLASITIPNSVTSIGVWAFERTRWFDSQPMGLVYAGRVAYKYKGKMPNGTRITLKEGTLGIAESAFQYCLGLKSITIPNSVTTIGEEAFIHCTGLISISIPNSVTNIGRYAFAECENLTVNVPKGALNRFDKGFIRAKRLIEAE